MATHSVCSSRSLTFESKLKVCAKARGSCNFAEMKKGALALVKISQEGNEYFNKILVLVRNVLCFSGTPHTHQRGLG